MTPLRRGGTLNVKVKTLTYGGGQSLVVDLSECVSLKPDSRLECYVSFHGFFEVRKSVGRSMALGVITNSLERGKWKRSAIKSYSAVTQENTFTFQALPPNDSFDFSFFK